MSAESENPMNKLVFLEIWKKLKTKPKLLRKVKMIVLIAVSFVVIIGGLMIWAGVSTYNYVASATNQVMQSPSAQARVEDLKSELKALPKIQVQSCLAQAQSLLTFQPWIDRTALENLTSLKTACLEKNQLQI